MSHRLLLALAAVAALLLANCVSQPGRTAAGDDWWQAVPAGSQANTLDGVVAGGDDAWDAGAGVYTIEQDPLVGQVLCVPQGKNLALEGRTAYKGPRLVSAMLRFRGDAVTTFTLTLARRQQSRPDPKDPAKTITRDLNLRMTLTANKPADTIAAAVTHDNGPFFDPALAEKLDWGLQSVSSFNIKLHAYQQFMPGWPEQFRAQLEHDMAELPSLADKWVSVRVELRKGQARFWMEDRMIAWKNDAAIDPDGTMRIDLSSGGQLAQFRTTALDDAPTLAGFSPVPLTAYNNATGLLGAAAVLPQTLPPAGAPVLVSGVPFVFPGRNPQGNDHIDIGRSFLRQGNWQGYIATLYGTMPRWLGSGVLDPARIQLRIPNGQFKALHLIAASDGEKDALPVITAMFYRPGAGFAQSFSASAPLATAASSQAQALPVTLSNGRKVNLYRVTIALDPGVLSSFGDLDVIEVELTKQVELYRSYPDPISYGYHQSGRPSSVHVYAATLEQVPVGFAWNPSPFGHVWQSPAQPLYIATVTNHTGQPQTGKLLVTTTSFDGTEKTSQEVPLTIAAAATPVNVNVNVPVKLHGYHDIQATLKIAGQDWTETRSLVKLAPDTRSARWSKGRGTLFGYWSYGGGHHTPKLEHHVRLMTMAGGRTSIGYPQNLPPEVKAMVDKHWAGVPAGAWEVSPQEWALQEPPDPAKVDEFTKGILAAWHKARDPIPADRRPDQVHFFPEPHISSRLSAGNIPEYWSEEPYQLTDDEKTRLKMFFNTSKIAAQAVRKEFPGVKVFIPWGDPGFVWPLLRAGFPKDLIDGSGLDIPGFERLPERQLHEQSLHRLYMTRKEFEKAGIPNPDLRFIEGIFVPTEPGAVTWREQMDIYQRWTLLSMAYGITQFYSGWFAFDCTNYYGAEHYGGCGIQGKIPYCNPKPAYAAYATMTDKLNEANFDGWLPTGSHSTYALRFKKADDKGYVYALWTLRGSRPVTLTLDADAAVAVTDSMNNTTTVPSKDKTVTVATNPSVTYITFATPTGQIAAAQVGAPDHGDAQPAPGASVVADLGDGSWRLTDERDIILETNHWAMMHYLGKFAATVEQDPAQGKVLTTMLLKQDKVHELMPWYNVLKPRAGKGITLAGAPARLGLWVKGGSDWGRFIYVLRDAKGERWESIGTKDQYNCDDVHSWSMFNFDGWRYLSFELPGHAGWDSFRKAGTTWWRSDDGDEVVDLPLTLESIIVEQRSHLLYVNDVQPAASDRVSLGKLFVEYEKPQDATGEAVRISRLRMPMPADTVKLPNPIAEMTQSGVGQATRILRIRPPEHMADGTRAHVDFPPVEGAQAHYLWVSAHADGRAAVNMLPGGIASGQMVTGLRPDLKLYYWIVYKDKEGKLSKPSAAWEQVLLDSFLEK